MRNNRGESELSIGNVQQSDRSLGDAQETFDVLDKEFHFTLDVCANDQNHKCRRYYTKHDDGLSELWGERNWMNPPYGREIGKWVKKASENPLTVCLLPARTDTHWFHDYIYGRAEIRFIKGRLKFGGSKNPAPFPSMIVIFRNRKGKLAA